MNEYDVVVVGGGAAGLSAALVLARARRSVAVVDAGSPRNAPAAHMQGFLSRDGMPPRDLLAAGRAEVASYGGTLIDDEVLGIDAIDPGFRVRLAGGSSLTARRVLVATGLRRRGPRHPGRARAVGSRPAALPVLPRLRGPRPAARRPRRHHRGRSARPAAPAVVRRRHVLPAHLRASPRTSASSWPPGGVRVVDGTVARLVVEDDRLQGVELVDGQVVPRTAVFVRPRLVANSGLLTGLGCELDENGWVVHDPSGRTTVAGVWVAGNAADPRAQVITAAGEGSAAAIALNAELVDEDVERDLAAHRSSH